MKLLLLALLVITVGIFLAAVAFSLYMAEGLGVLWP